MSVIIKKGGEEAWVSDFESGRKLRTNFAFAMVFWLGWGFSGATKNAKILESEGCVAYFCLLGTFLVIEREECDQFEESKVRIFDIDEELRWYVLRSGVLSGFWQKWY